MNKHTLKNVFVYVCMSVHTYLAVCLSVYLSVIPKSAERSKKPELIAINKKGLKLSIKRKELG